MKKHKYLFVIFISLVSLNAQGSDGRIDCENVEDCPVDYTCRLGECVPDVDQDRDFDGVPNAGDNCIDVANAPQSDLDRDGIGDACDDDVRPGAISGYISYFVNDERLDLALINATIRLKRRSDPTIIAETQTDDTGQYLSLIHI